jgi:hypothetical protein
MKYGFFIFALVYVIESIPAAAFEARTPERDERHLRIELEPVPSQVQQDFDRYVQDLASASQKDATPEERARKDDAAKERQMKVVNPMVLFSW